MVEGDPNGHDCFFDTDVRGGQAGYLRGQLPGQSIPPNTASPDARSPSPVPPLAPQSGPATTAPLGQVQHFLAIPAYGDLPIDDKRRKKGIELMSRYLADHPNATHEQVVSEINRELITLGVNAHIGWEEPAARSYAASSKNIK